MDDNKKDFKNIKIVDIKTDKANNNLFYKYVDENGIEQEETIFIYNEDGTHTPEVVELFANYQNNKELINSNEFIVKDAKKDFDNKVIKTKGHKIVNEYAKTPILDAAIATASTAIALTTIALIITACQGCGKKDLAETDLNNKVSIESSMDESTVGENSTTLDTLMNDSRYTEITEEMLVQTTQDLSQELSNHGIVLNDEDALIFVTVANITHMQKTNPELLTKVLGEDAEAENVIAKAYSIMGNMMTLYSSPKQDKTIDWTIAFMDKTDKKIAQHYIENVVNKGLTFAYDTEMNHETKKTEIQKLIIDNYIIPIRDNTAYYVDNNGDKFYGPQEDGAQFITTIMMTSMLQPDFGTLIAENTKQPAFIDGEVLDDVNDILKNTDTAPVIMRIIEGCTFSNNEDTTSYSR